MYQDMNKLTFIENELRSIDPELIKPGGIYEKIYHMIEIGELNELTFKVSPTGSIGSVWYSVFQHTFGKINPKYKHLLKEISNAGEIEIDHEVRGKSSTTSCEMIRLYSDKNTSGTIFRAFDYIFKEVNKTNGIPSIAAFMVWVLNYVGVSDDGNIAFKIPGEELPSYEDMFGVSLDYHALDTKYTKYRRQVYIYR